MLEKALSNYVSRLTPRVGLGDAQQGNPRCVEQDRLFTGNSNPQQREGLKQSQ